MANTTTDAFNDVGKAYSRLERLKEKLRDAAENADCGLGADDYDLLDEE